MKKHKPITYAMAEYAYASHLRDNGHTGEIIYPNKDTSKQQTDGSWLLLTITGASSVTSISSSFTSIYGT